MAITYATTNEIFRVAIEAYKRMAQGEDKTAYANDALVAIMFSVVTLESFMAELVDRSAYFNKVHNKINVFVGFMGELDKRESSGSIKMKYYMARWIICNEPFDRGKTPYQDLELLVDIRNAISHLRPDKLGVKKIEHILTTLSSKKLIRKHNYELGRGLWFRYLYDVRVARWACNTSVSIVKGIWGDAPEAEVRHYFNEMISGIPLLNATYVE